jgi:hypothetical protein
MMLTPREVENSSGVWDTLQQEAEIHSELLSGWHPILCPLLAVAPIPGPLLATGPVTSLVMDVAPMTPHVVRGVV